MENDQQRNIEHDNAETRSLKNLISLGQQLPHDSEPHILASKYKNIPSLPDRFNDAFIEHGWVYVSFACSIDAAEHSISMHNEGINQTEIDSYLAERLLGVETIKWNALRLMGGSLSEPKYPIRAKTVERVFEAYENKDYIVFTPLVLMLVDGFGVSETGTKSMFAELSELSELFQSWESVAGHPSALRTLLSSLGKSQKGYSEAPLTMPLRNGILHGVRLNYANNVISAKALNLLAAVIEWAQDIAPEAKSATLRQKWNADFLRQNLVRLNPISPDRALELFQAALSAQRPTDLVALTSYHPIVTLLSEKIKEWRELDYVNIAIQPRTEWQIFGGDHDNEQNARCNALISVTSLAGEIKTCEQMIYAVRSAELAQAGLPSVWRIELAILGAIRLLLDPDC